MYSQCVCTSRINLKMEHRGAAKIVALRPALEALIVKATTEPESVQEPGQLDSDLMNVVRALSKVQSGRFGIQDDRPMG